MLEHFITKLWSPSCFCPQGRDIYYFDSCPEVTSLKNQTGKVLDIQKDLMCLSFGVSQTSSLFVVAFCLFVFVWACSVQSLVKHGLFNLLCMGWQWFWIRLRYHIWQATHSCLYFLFLSIYEWHKVQCQSLKWNKHNRWWCCNSQQYVSTISC